MAARGRSRAPQAARIDRFLMVHSGRADGWRELGTLSGDWAAGHATRAEVERALALIAPVEEYFAYPGHRLMAALGERVAAEDAAGVARLVQRIGTAILTRSWQDQAADWETRAEAGAGEVADILPPTLGEGGRRPAFETLFVTPQPPARWPALAAEIRRLRRAEDGFVYEPVLVGSFEDAFCAVVLNPGIASVVVSEGVAYRSRHDLPVLRSVLAPLADPESPDRSALRLARLLKQVRPELDLFILSDRRVEDLAVDPAAALVRRIFYAVEEPLEIHLAILEGVQDRYQTPFFDNLKKYARRPIGTFHALPIARGKSVFKSDWIRDMGELCGIDLLLAESSATTGGLDSLLEPTGNIKKAQELAAPAFGADHVFFVTNGTSTSNKMAVQALVGPGDVVIVDRNCHKSHH